MNEIEPIGEGTVREAFERAIHVAKGHLRDNLSTRLSDEQVRVNKHDPASKEALKQLIDDVGELLRENRWEPAEFANMTMVDVFDPNSVLDSYNDQDYLTVLNIPKNTFFSEDGMMPAVGRWFSHVGQIDAPFLGFETMVYQKREGKWHTIST